MINNKGFSLIEVLVALLLTTIGILGMVALQGRSIQYTQDSVQRNTAVELTNDLIEVMRANPNELFNMAPPQFPMNSGIKENSIFFKAKGEALDNREDCVLNANTIPKTAKELRDCWAENVEAKLPGGEEIFESNVYVCRSSTPGACDNKGSMLEVQLAWQTQEGGCLDSADTDASVCTYSIRVEL
ncbi:type IV pilus modification protein PilV [Pseudomonas sp. EA_35y_Pfl2_R5]|uniref:type IV pilus modification protein PilV n=1 Tax=Pseudomonas sp. EA_35y_Pfl2_R5 TaxID=3088690 RepID=UPI0030DC085A